MSGFEFKLMRLHEDSKYVGAHGDIGPFGHLEARYNFYTPTSEAVLQIFR